MSRPFPSRSQLSVLTATILLAYALARFVELPARAIHFTVLGSALGFDLSGTVLLLLLAAALIATGADTLIRSHPYYASGAIQGTVVHWIVPGAAGLALGVALARLPAGPAWWLGLAGSALALMVVFVAEFMVVDPADPAHDLAALALAVLTYALALVLFALVYAASARAAISATITGAAAAALAWRLFALRRAPLGPAALYAALVGLICAESVWALNYWRLPSGAAGLIILVPFYVGAGVAQQHLTGRLTRRVWIEFGVVALLGLALATVYTVRPAG